MIDPQGALKLAERVLLAGAGGVAEKAQAIGGKSGGLAVSLEAGAQEAKMIPGGVVRKTRRHNVRRE